MGENEKIDALRIVKVAGAIVVSSAVGIFFQPMVDHNTDAVNTVVTIFSILAGFLIAVITLVAEPILKQAKSWEDLQLMKKTVARKLRRQTWLFFFYLLTLGVALGIFLVPETQQLLRKILEGTFLGLATFVFLASFTLPGSLMKIQLDRYQAELDAAMPDVLREAVNAKAAKETDKPKI